MQTSLKKIMPCKIDVDGFGKTLGKENGSKLASKSWQKSILTSNDQFARKPVKNNVFLTLYENVTNCAQSKVILMQFENFCISMYVSDSAKKKQL